MVDIPTPPRRRWFQDNPHAIIWIGLILLIFGGIAALATWLQPALRQRSARRTIEAAGGSISYAYGVCPPFRCTGPEWVRNLFGDDFVSDIVWATVETDASAQAICSFPKLTRLTMIDSQVTDTAMEYVEGCPLLESVFLYHTRVSVSGLHHLKKLSCLTSLQLVGENVTDEWLELLAKNGQLQRMQHLDISSSKITDKGLKLIRMSPHIRWLYLHHTNVTDAGLESIKGLSELQTLYLDDTKVTDAGMEIIKGLSKLETLQLDDTKVTDAGIEQLRGLTNLYSLGLDGTQLTDAGIKHLIGLSQLQSLDISDTMITDAGIEQLRKLTNLGLLSLEGTKLTDAGLEHLKGLKQLRYLNISNTMITDAGLEHLAGLHQLEFLKIDNTKVTREGVERLENKLPDCSID